MEYQFDDLHKEEWRSYFDAQTNTLYLDVYIMWERESKRHKWKVFQSYHRTGREEPDAMNVEQVPFTPEIQALLKQEFIDKIKVKIWIEK